MTRATKPRTARRRIDGTLPRGAPADRIPLVPGAPPYSLATPAFRFPAMAALAGRAPIGGDREMAIGCLVGLRLAAGALPPHRLPVVVRAERSAAAKAWVTALALPPAARTAFVKLADAAGDEDPGLLRSALVKFVNLCSPALDGPARLEAERFVAELSPAS